MFKTYNLKFTDYMLVPEIQILFLRLNIKFHITYSRAKYEDGDGNDKKQKLSQLVPMAFLYASRTGPFAEVTPTPTTTIEGTEANNYANSAVVVSQPASVCDSDAIHDGLDDLERAMRVLRLVPSVHPMQIAPDGLVRGDRKVWRGRCEKEVYPKWMEIKETMYQVV